MAARLLQPRYLLSCLDAIDYFAAGFVGMRREALRVAHLDRHRRVIGLRMHFSDHCDEAPLPLRRIVADALTLGSHGLIIAHNHPSGDATPSRADLDATRALADLLRPLDIRLHDHLIFAAADCRSLWAMGLL